MWLCAYLPHTFEHPLDNDRAPSFAVFLRFRSDRFWVFLYSSNLTSLRYQRTFPCSRSRMYAEKPASPLCSLSLFRSRSQNERSSIANVVLSSRQAKCLLRSRKCDESITSDSETKCTVSSSASSAGYGFSFGLKFDSQTSMNQPNSAN